MPPRAPSETWGGEDFVLLDDEDVVGGALGDEALLVEEDRFLRAVEVAFNLGEDVVEVVERFDGGAERGGGDALGRHGVHAQALGVIFFRVELDGGGDAEDGRLAAFVGVEAEVALAAGDDKADVAVAQLVLAAGFEDDVAEGVAFEGDGEEDGLGGIVEAVGGAPRGERRGRCRNGCPRTRRRRRGGRGRRRRPWRRVR